LSSRRDSVRSRRRRQNGIALLVVLWVLALLSVLLVGFAGDTRTELLVARNQYENAHARAIADAGVSLAIIGVLDPTPESQWPADGTARAFEYDGGTIRVHVQDEAGKIDLNAAPPELLSSLMRTLGVADADAVGVSQAIARWRQTHQPAPAVEDGRDLVRPPSRSPDAVFVAVEQLRLVPGVTRALYERLFPFITVYSGLPDVDPLTASTVVLRSLPGVNLGEIDRFVAQRQVDASSLDTVPSLTGVGFMARRPLQAATIASEGRTANGARFVREAVVAITREPATPYHILAWRQGQQDEQTASAETSDPASLPASSSPAGVRRSSEPGHD
jgi:general secretion pathway protein K